MKNRIVNLLIAFYLLSGSTYISGQKTEGEIIPLEAGNWEFKKGTVEFTEENSEPAMTLLPGAGEVVLKDLDMSDGIISYDMKPLTEGFTSFYFRWKDQMENECFYFRTWKAGDPQDMNAVQYSPTVDGVNLWDLFFHYQANAAFTNNEWNHVKLVVCGKQMRAYVGDISSPVLSIPMLEGNTSSGTLAFDGEVMISNLRVIRGETDGLNPEAGIDPLENDTRYLRNWQVSEPVSAGGGVDFRDEYLPDDNTMWEDIAAERRGLINLTRKYGKTQGRRIVWLRTNIESDREQKKILRLGFSDEVWVVINGSPLYLDKNLYNTAMEKKPGGRCSIENTSFFVPLKKGKNELMIGVSNFFYGWGIVARFDDLEGISIQ